MDWSPRQQAAIDDIRAWLADSARQQIRRLFGYAGSGKTTLARHLAADAGRVAFAAYTGKAALVLRQKGCPGASTIHQLIYLPKDKSAVHLKQLEGQLITARAAQPVNETHVAELEGKVRAERMNLKRPSFSLNTESEIADLDLLVLDEVSMVGASVGGDLCSFGIPILALGDPAQLPPVADGGFFTNQKPDVMLDEVHRQAEGSPIIAMATAVRRGGDLEMGDRGGGCRVIHRSGFRFEESRGFDQVLVGKNETRRKFNTRYRDEILGLKDHLPVEGDRLVCLRNNHEKGLLNGSLWVVVQRITIDDDSMALIVRDPDTGIEIATEAHRHHFEGREDDLAPWAFKEADAFDYGYALTVHKAQGSQWNNVLLVDEGHVFRDNARRWRYTGITRAAEQLTVMKT